MPNVPLNALRAFEAVARNLSFSKGARELHVTTAAVSAQVRALEARLDQKLFRRQGRQIALTAAGRLLFPGVERGMREVRQALQRLEAERTGGVLNVTMLPGFLQKWLMPRLGDFQERHGSIDLRINTGDAPVDFDRTDFHAAIRFGPGATEGVDAVLLLEDWILPVCSPRYLSRHPDLRTPRDLERHDLLYVDSDLWDPWFQAMGAHGKIRRQKVLNDAMAILMAAELGEGIALSRWSLVARDIAAGRLVRPLPGAVKTAWSYWFLTPTQHRDMPKVRIFREWLKDQCDGFERPDAEAGPPS